MTPKFNQNSQFSVPVSVYIGLAKITIKLFDYYILDYDFILKTLEMTTHLSGLTF